MSNLVKVNYVISNPNENAFVINTNDRVEEKLAQLAKEMEKSQNAESNFKEGLFGETVEIEPIEETVMEPTAEEIIQEANEQAQLILNEARAKADEMLNDAHQKGIEAFEEQKRLGYAAGEEALRTQINEERMAMERENASFRQNIEHSYNERMATMENDIIDAVIEVFDHVFHIQFEDKKEILIALVTNVLQNVESGKNFRIHVNTADVDIMREHALDFSELVGNGAVVEIVRDQKLLENECRIESEFGLFDCSLDTEYKNLIKDIRSLCK